MPTLFQQHGSRLRVSFQLQRPLAFFSWGAVLCTHLSHSRFSSIPQQTLTPFPFPAVSTFRILTGSVFSFPEPFASFKASFSHRTFPFSNVGCLGSFRGWILSASSPFPFFSGLSGIALFQSQSAVYFFFFSSCTTLHSVQKRCPLPLSFFRTLFSPPLAESCGRQRCRAFWPSCDTLIA